MTDPSPAGGFAWRLLLRRTLLLLAVWFLAGPVLGILLVEPLNRVRVGGLPVGFWVSQQGSIYVFVVLIFVYAWLSDRADARERTARSAERGEHP
jgi:putative solute:sodium symporter small subunit